MQRSAKGNEAPVVRPKDVTTFQRAPDVGQLFDFLAERSLLRCQENRVDGTSRDSGDDLEANIRKMFCDASKEADLIRRPRAATGEHDGEIAALYFDTLSDCY